MPSSVPQIPSKPGLPPDGSAAPATSASAPQITRQLAVVSALGTGCAPIVLFGAAGGIVVAGFGYFLFSFVLPSAIVLAAALPAYFVLRRLRTVPASVAGVAVLCTSFLVHGLTWLWKGIGAMALVPRWASMEPMTSLILSHLLLATVLLHIQLMPSRVPTKESL